MRERERKGACGSGVRQNLNPFNGDKSPSARALLRRAGRQFVRVYPTYPDISTVRPGVARVANHPPTSLAYPTTLPFSLTCISSFLSFFLSLTFSLRFLLPSFLPFSPPFVCPPVYLSFVFFSSFLCATPPPSTLFLSLSSLSSRPFLPIAIPLVRFAHRSEFKPGSRITRRRPLAKL